VARGFGALNLATPLVAGMSHSLGAWPPAAGVGLIGSMQAHPTHLWFDDRIEQGAAMALVLSGGVRMDTVIMHGCKPASGYHTITRAEGKTIYEIDGRPALDTIAEILGPESTMTWEDYPLFLILGVNRGDKFGEFKEEDYANRACMAIDTDQRTVMMFEPDLETGVEVQLMRRCSDWEEMSEYIGRRTKEVLERVGNRRPFLALYIDCGARASVYCGSEHEDAEEVQKALGPTVPLLGMYSGVEIARVGDHMQALDWTGVLCIFSEPATSEKE
jgi:hypothetical protein